MAQTLPRHRRAVPIQAAIAACTRGASTSTPTGRRSSGLYEVLELVGARPDGDAQPRGRGRPMVDGPEAGLASLDGLDAAEVGPATTTASASVRAHLLEDAGRPADARAELSRGPGLTSTLAERAILLDRAARLDP